MGAKKVEDNVWATCKLYDTKNNWGNNICLREKGRAYRWVTPFIGKKIKEILYINEVLDSVSKNGYTKVHFVDHIKIFVNNHEPVKIPLGTREIIMRTAEFSAEQYRSAGRFSLESSLPIMKRACDEGLLPKDIIQPDVLDWLDRAMNG